MVLQAVAPPDNQEEWEVRIDADTNCLCLVLILLDLELWIKHGIECWRHTVPCCEYGLDPELARR